MAVESRRSLPCAAALVALLVPPAAAAQARVTASSIVADLRHGQPVVLTGAVVRGDVDLRPLGSIRRPFKCRDCRFVGRVDASDVVFSRTVDLSGSRFDGPVVFRGASLAGPAVFGSTGEQGTTFRRGADFSLAIFDDLAGFDSAAFVGRADFRNTRFRTDASFAGASFGPDGPAAFERASFRGAASFRQALFDAPARFDEASFRGPANFGQAEFARGAAFDSAQLVTGGSFLGATFTRPGEGLAASFVRVGTGRDLDFTFARFQALGGGRPRGDRQIASFFGVVSAATVSFRSAYFEPGYTLELNDIAAGGLRMDVDAVDQVEGSENQRQALRLIESSAKARGDLGEANEAYYRLRTLLSEDYSAPLRALDAVFYRGVAGYLVRPLRPLLALVALAAVLTLVRVGRRAHASRRGPARQRGRARESARRVGVGATRAVDEYLRTLSLVGPQRGDEDDRAELARRLETYAYRLLLVCALIALANTNPTLRDMVDALV